MTNKDLNLSRINNLIKPKNVLQQTPDANNATATRAALKLSKSTVAPSGPAHDQPPPQLTASNSLHQPTIIGVVMANAVFVLLIGIWLERPYSSNLKANTTSPIIESHSGVALVELSKQVKSLQLQMADERDELRQQLNDLQLALRIEQQQIVSGYLDMNELLQGAIVQSQTTTKSTPPTSAKTPLKNWYVNIGTFVNESAALGLQQQIIDLGYPATINAVTLDGKVAQRVQLPGFVDRASAEVVAQKLMESTQLNGLWAWKGK